MKTKSIILFVAIALTINAFSQKQNEKFLYTFCGKSGDCTMTLDEFKKCKELTTITNSIKINSFHIVIGKEGTYADYFNTGSVYSSQTVTAIEKAINEKKINAGSKILIDEVQLSQGDKIVKVSGMVITVK